MDLAVLVPYVPHKDVLPLIEQWFAPHHCSLHITRPRTTKIGDFRPPRPGQQAKITLNGNLKPYQFLTTLVHELAHLKTWERYGRKAAPHGVEWKTCFAAMMLELVDLGILPMEYEEALILHAKSPKSTVGADPKLQKVLMELDGEGDVLLLSDLGPGAKFSFRGRQFTYQEKRRSRALVQDVENGRQYTVALVAPVELLD